MNLPYHVTFLNAFILNLNTQMQVKIMIWREGKSVDWMHVLMCARRERNRIPENATRDAQDSRASNRLFFIGEYHVPSAVYQCRP